MWQSAHVGVDARVRSPVEDPADAERGTRMWICGQRAVAASAGEWAWRSRLHVDRLVAVLRIWQSAHVGVDARVRSTVRPMENAGRASWRQLSGMRTVGKNKFTSGEKVLDEIPRVPRLATAMRRLIHRWRR
jgi:hypothetical protein